MLLSALAESDKGKEEMKKPPTSGALPPALGLLEDPAGSVRPAWPDLCVL